MFGEKLFQTKLLSRLSHKVCRPLSSPVLLRKFTVFGATATSTGRDIIICWILRMLMLTTLPSWSRRRRETGLFGVVAKT